MKSFCFSFPSTAIYLWLAASLPAVAQGATEECGISREAARLEAGQGTPADTVLPASAAPHFGVHGQLLYGESPFYLSHLAVFMGQPDNHPHNFQVVLEVAFDDPGAQGAYLVSRQATPADIHTAVPQSFDQMALVADEPGRQLLRTLPSTRIVSGHFEQGGQDIIPPTDLSIERVVYFREFVTGGEKLDRSEYLLFGRSDEMFLSHLLCSPGFSEVLEVEFTGDGNTGDLLPTQLDAVLAEGLYLTLPGRQNAVAERLRPEETLLCNVNINTRLPLATAGIHVVNEVYCEDGELSALVLNEFNAASRCAP